MVRVPATVAREPAATGEPAKDRVHPPAVGELLPLVRTVTGCMREEAQEKLKSRSLRLATGLSRAQAEELTSRLGRKRVVSRVVRG